MIVSRMLQGAASYPSLKQRVWLHRHNVCCYATCMSAGIAQLL
jgi:hypothetical protein